MGRPAPAPPPRAVFEVVLGLTAAASYSGALTEALVAGRLPNAAPGTGGCAEASGFCVKPWKQAPSTSGHSPQSQRGEPPLSSLGKLNF